VCVRELVPRLPAHCRQLHTHAEQLLRPNPRPGPPTSVTHSWYLRTVVAASERTINGPAAGGASCVNNPRATPPKGANNPRATAGMFCVCQEHSDACSVVTRCRDDMAPASPSVLSPSPVQRPSSSFAGPRPAPPPLAPSPPPAPPPPPRGGRRRGCRRRHHHLSSGQLRPPHDRHESPCVKSTAQPPTVRRTVAPAGWIDGIDAYHIMVLLT
jgi:hypothetical protein